MTSKPTKAPRKPRTAPRSQADVLDAEAVARGQILAFLDGRVADSRRLHLAITRHTLAVTAAGGAIDLDWYTRQVLIPARGVG